MYKNAICYILLSATFFTTSGCSGQTKTHQINDSIYQYQTASNDGIGKIYKGREIAHVMDASGSSWLERNDRQKEEHVEQAIDSILLESPNSIADIGAGTGYYTFRLARKNSQGKVYAIEVQNAMISQLKIKKDQTHQSNVLIIKGSDTSVNLPQNSIDLALMVDVYHELEYPHEILQSLYKALKPSGKLLVLEYRAEDPSIAIKPLHKLSVMQANEEMEANGFVLYKRKEFLPIQHFLLYKKR